jgi:catalase (peroxidase I)
MLRRFGFQVGQQLRQFSYRSSFTTNFQFTRSLTQRVIQRPQILRVPVSIGFLGFLFGSSVDYDAVKKDIADILDDYDWDDGSWGPVLIRLAWHSSGTYDKSDNSGGSNGATMRYALEAGDGANAGLNYARDKLEQIKEKYPNISYADLWILASYVAIAEMGGPVIEFRSGRKDASSESACPANGRLPDAAQGAQHIRDVFYRMGFNDQEIVALIGGGHAIGRCHTDRSGFDGPWTRSPTTVSNEFFVALFDEKWVEKKWSGPRQFIDNKTGNLMMLPADLALKSDPEFRKYSEIYKKDNERFLSDFADAYKRLTELGM